MTHVQLAVHFFKNTVERGPWAAEFAAAYDEYEVLPNI